jgi:hypothetical protein
MIAVYSDVNVATRIRLVEANRSLKGVENDEQAKVGF